METIVRECPQCGKKTTLEVDSKQLCAYNRGALLQEAFPDLDVFTRECIRTGMCFDCSSKVFHMPKPGDDSWGEILGECYECGAHIYSIQDAVEGGFECAICHTKIGSKEELE